MQQTTSFPFSSDLTMVSTTTKDLTSGTMGGLAQASLPLLVTAVALLLTPFLATFHVSPLDRSWYALMKTRITSPRPYKSRLIIAPTSSQVGQPFDLIKVVRR